MKYLFQSIGYDDTTDFMQSVFHLQQWKPISAVLSVLTLVAYFVEEMLGVKAVVIVAIMLLFGLELYTGIKASIKEGVPLDSKKFPRGWVKLFIYFALIFCANVFANNVSHLEYGDLDFNHYRWIHYALINFAILQFFISVIENCVRLGWDEYLPLIGWIAEKLKLIKKK